MGRRQELKKKGLEYCQGCLKFKDGECTVLKKLWPEFDGEGECWAREVNPFKWKQTLEDIRRYRVIPEGQKAFDLNREIQQLETAIQEGSFADWYEVYNQEVHRANAKKGGGGEKADRTNKAFGPQQMKDNRFMHRKRNPAKYR